MDFNTNQQTSKLIDTLLRVILLFGLIGWCLYIISPFIFPVLWGVIIAVAVKPIHIYFTKFFKRNNIVASVVLTILLLVCIIVPGVLAITSIADSAMLFKSKFETGEWVIDAPSIDIKNWPIVGEKVYQILFDITADLSKVVVEYKEQVTALILAVAKSLMSTGVLYFELIFTVIIAGILLATNNTLAITIQFANRIIGNQGAEFVDLIGSTIRNVVRGVLGVAVIQSLLASIGLFAADIPHAGFWVIICLVLCVVQVGPALVLIPAAIYLYLNASATFATIWTIYFVFVLISDNIIKPILLGKNAPVPMLVILLGVIGGLITGGFLGMFTGAIILSIGYKLFISWLHQKHIV